MRRFFQPLSPVHAARATYIATVLTFCGYALLLEGCPPSKVVTPGPDATDAAPNPSQDICGDACVVLRTLGCPEGDKKDGGATCEETCDHARASTFNLKPECVADKTSIEGVRSCGTVRCRRP